MNEADLLNKIYDARLAIKRERARLYRKKRKGEWLWEETLDRLKDDLALLLEEN